VIAGSTGVGGVLPYRLAGERNHAEGLESTTRMFPDWFHPRLRFFSGREDRLPVDGNLLLALVAPRACIMVSGFNDQVANTWGDEQSLHSAAKAYALLGVPAAQRLGLLRVPGFHGANDMERALDFLDIQFGRSSRAWSNEFVFPWNFEDWRQRSGATADPAAQQISVLGNVGSVAEWEPKARQVRASIESMLGKPPTLMQPVAGRGPGGRGRGGAGAARGPTTAIARGNPGQTAPDLVNWVIQQTSRSYGWFADEAAQTVSRSVRFGHNVRGDLYYPANTPAGAKLPTVIWLHSYSYPLGYMCVYRHELHPVLALVKQGYAVLAFDQCGFGSRMNEAGAFYDRWPMWSIMGRMVEDVRAAVGALQSEELVDPDRIYLFGYSLGGNVALHAAALDSRIKGVVSIGGFTPMRTDTADRGAGGLARYSTERPLVPRLGLYIGNESKLPYDYDEIIAAIAPRPVYVLQPQFDRDAHPDDVRAAVEQARNVYALFKAEDALKLDEPLDYNRLPTTTQDRIIAWMTQTLK
jgi:dienelactone hydrolase